jgi:hypothetical protein
MSVAIEQTLAVMCVTIVNANVQSQGLNMGNGLMNKHTGYADIPFFKISLIFKQDYDLPFPLDHFTTKDI